MSTPGRTPRRDAYGDIETPHSIGRRAFSVNGTWVGFTLDAMSQRHKAGRDARIETRGASKTLKLVILASYHATSPSLSWQDEPRDRIERHLAEIVVGLILRGEESYRDSCQHRYEWLVERKADLIRRIQEEKEEAERQERERIRQMERARIDRLLGEAAALRQATDIRTYVAAVRERCEEHSGVVGKEQLTAWAEWALREADRIDPVSSKRFLSTCE
jgi:hypothetical protein